MLTAEQQQPAHGIAAVIQRRNELPALDVVAIDSWRRHDPMRQAERLDPHASGVMNVGGQHANGSTRSSGNRCRPKRTGQILNEKCRHSIVGIPGRKDHRRKSSGSWRHGLHHDWLRRHIMPGSGSFRRRALEPCGSLLRRDGKTWWPSSRRRTFSRACDIDMCWPARLLVFCRPQRPARCAPHR